MQLIAKSRGPESIHETLEIQDQHWIERASNKNAPNRIIFAEHEPVYTAGASAKIEPRNIQNCFKVNISELACPVVVTGRGGLVTYQGPGILSVYCVFELDNVTIRDFENILLDAAEALLNLYGIGAVRRRNNPGLYLGTDRKIVSVGLKISRGVTRYGITVSLDPDFAYLEPLIPCGLSDVHLTSLAEETGRKKFSEREKNAIKTSLAIKLVSRLE